MNYYNDSDLFCADWLGNLAAQGLIGSGRIDQRSIRDVQPDDLAGFRRCHFFAGIAGWELALQLAGWPDDREVWTGSCPCQPFSSAGKRKGTADDRHLWPEFFRLISKCRPAIVFGEQVAGSGGLRWLDGVFADMEGIDYACGAADLPAACVGQAQKRQRLFWVAESIDNGTSGPVRAGEFETWRSCEADRVANASGAGVRGGSGSYRRAAAAGSGKEPEWERVWAEPWNVGRRMGDTECERPQGSANGGDEPERQRQAAGGSAGLSGRFDFIPCRDGKTRRVESGIECLVDGVSFRLADGSSRSDTSRAGCLRGFGNAIVPRVAAEFIKAFLG